MEFDICRGQETNLPVDAERRLYICGLYNTMSCKCTVFGYVLLTSSRCSPHFSLSDYFKKCKYASVTSLLKSFKIKKSMMWLQDCTTVPFLVILCGPSSSFHCASGLSCGLVPLHLCHHLPSLLS